MGTKWMKNPHVQVNSIDLSAHVKKAGVKRSYQEEDSTVGNAAGTEETTLTLEAGEFMLEFRQDFDADLVNETLWGIGRSEVPVIVGVEPTASATNPHYTGNCVLPEYSPFDEEIGKVIGASVRLKVNGGISEDTGGV